MANTTPSTGGTAPRPTDPSTTSMTGTATGTATDSSTPSTTDTSTQTSTTDEHKPGDTWVEEVTVPESEQVDEKIREQAAKEDKLRRENPNAVVYRKVEKKTEAKSDTDA